MSDLTTAPGSGSLGGSSLDTTLASPAATTPTPVTPAAAPVTEAPVTNPSTLEQNLNTVLKTAPELGRSPGLAVGVATSGGDPQVRAQAVARGTQAMAGKAAMDRVAPSVGGQNALSTALNWFGGSVAHYVGDAGSDLEHAGAEAGGAALKTLNQPLQFVQHEYRYLHDVEANHGATAALLEGLGIAAGAAAGFASGGGVEGAVLGGEAATALESQVFYKDSWQRTQSASYEDPHTHEQVSIGRDLASVLGLAPGSMGFKVGSGIIDGIADIGLDPLAAGGKLQGAARSAEGLSGRLGEYFGGTAPVNGEDVWRIFDQYASVRRAFGDIASKDAGQIIATPAYQSLRDPLLLRRLGSATSAEDVAAVFADAFRAHELSFTRQVPTLSWTRAMISQPFREGIENAGEGPVAGIGARLARGLTRLPESYDAVAHSISDSDFDPSSTVDDGALGIYRMLRFGERRDVAASVVEQYVHAPDLESKIAIYRNATLDMLFHMSGVRNDPEAQRVLAAALDDALGGGQFGKEAWYGVNDGDFGALDGGRNLSKVHDVATGKEYGAAILDNQTGKLRFLNLTEAKRASNWLQGAHDYYGRLDDFAYRHFTQGLFKPLVLLTPSYALHISLAELIPNMLRAGVGNIAKSAVAINAAKLGSKASEDELGAIGSVAWRLIGGTRDTSAIRQLLDDPSNLADSDFGHRLQLAARYIEYNDGHFVAAGLSTAHYSPGELGGPEEEAVNVLGRTLRNIPMKSGRNFEPIGVGAARYVDSWQASLREIANDGGSQVAAREMLDSARRGEDLSSATNKAVAKTAEWLRAQDPAYLGKYLRSRADLTSYSGGRPDGMDQFEEWAQVKVANLRGATRGADGTLHVPLLQHVADGEDTGADELNAVKEHQRPILVKGREVMPDGTSKLQRFVNKGFGRVLNPMVNFLSREPIAFEEFERQWDTLQHAIDDGRIDEDEAMTIAMDRTVNTVIRQVHNIHDKTQWTITMRNWAPFYFAQEQAYRRFGRLLATDPGAFRRYQLMIANLHDIGTITQGPNGDNYFVLPGTGWLTEGPMRVLAKLFPTTFAGSAPVGMGWNLSAMSVVFPLSNGVRPDLGPVVQVPVQAIASFFPELMDSARVNAPNLNADVASGESFVLGSSAASTPLWQQVFPNTIVLRLVQALNGGQHVDDRSFDSAFMQTIATLAYEHRTPPANAGPWAMQQFLDRVRNQTRVMYAIKAIVGAITPVSPEVTNPTDSLFVGRLDEMIQRTGSINKGITEFLAKYPDATAFTVFQSTSPLGEDIPSSVDAENWINDHMAFINKYPEAGLYFMPQVTNTTYSPTVYNEQIAQGLRQKWFPGDVTPNGQLEGYLAQLYINAGNNFILDNPDNYPSYKASIASQSGSQKYETELKWQNFIANYQISNPVWGAYWGADTKHLTRGQTINQVQAMVSNHDIPDPQSSLAQGIVGLMKDYDTYKGMLSSGLADGYAGTSETAINQQWDDYLTSVAQSNPELRSFINGVFVTLPTSMGAGNG